MQKRQSLRGLRRSPWQSRIEGGDAIYKRQMEDYFVQKQVTTERKLCKEEKGIKY